MVQNTPLTNLLANSGLIPSKTIKGITISTTTGPLYLQPDRPKPKLRSGYMIVRPTAIALNPADVHIMDWGFSVPGALMGCDYAGVIIDIDQANSTRGWKIGDRVCGATRAGDKNEFENGTFAEEIAVKADIQLAIPEGLKEVEAAALGANVLTTGRAFYNKFGLPYPEVSEDGTVDTDKQPRRQILVYGGSSAMGTMYIQFAKLSNFHVITTCSPHNFELVKSYGADYVVDYNSPTAISDLQSHTKSNEASMDPLEYCLDSISTEDSSLFCGKILNPNNTVDDGFRRYYSSILPWTSPLPGITKFLNLGYSFLGEEWEQMGKKNPPNMADYEAAKQFAITTTKLLALGKIKPHPALVREGGLEAVVEKGFDEMRKGMSGKKLVFAM